MESPVKSQYSQLESTVKCGNTQLRETVDSIFLEISTHSGHIVKLDNVKNLKEALKRNQCFDTAFPKGGPRFDYFENIKRTMTMNKVSRSTLITWIINFAGEKYCNKFEKKEKIEGIKMLMAPKMSAIAEPGNSEATTWFKNMCLKPPLDHGILVRHSLSKSIWIASKHEDVDFGIVIEDDLKKNLETKMISDFHSKIFDECLPEEILRDQRQLEKMRRIHLELPLCVLHAAEFLNVNIRVLCFPSKEEVNFYSDQSKTTGNATIHLGLIGQETYVPLIKITEDEPGTVASLKLTIENLKKKIEGLEKDLKNVEAKTKEEERILREQKIKYEKQLKEKEKEYKTRIGNISKDAKELIHVTAQAVAEEVAERVRQQMTERFAVAMNL